MQRLLAGLATVLALAMAPIHLRAAPPGHVTGVGGIFFKSHDPKALSAWYRDMLGITLEPWGGAILRCDFMIDFAVDDLDALIQKLRAKGVKILGRSDTDPTGKFAWIVDPDGTKIELWQPAHT
jgi:catechol 2,3-dioxygenase-like lactoylglutathione lyase family enzyme